MKRLVLFFVICFCAINCIAQKTNDFKFLIGSWKLENKKGKVLENWKIQGDSLIGESYQYNYKNEGKLTESMILKKINNIWHLCVTGYEAGNEGSTNFKLVSFVQKTFSFENKAHDFPQKICYQDQGKESLLAWIEGPDNNGKTLKITFPYKRKH
ncbi:DUF6265 family protein [Pedobacter montanisoli]|uniref:DUF6265 family protein n=1 Tax=Pedobacter montanisoli TaxID=2923277 RepID=A0ABS9ZT69_9SPHI|nr:DUF6265 family protein [Pedobacter montanisoli]MCJ0741782.1 DUF6265 family protein [Pedobacter montanisoli]